MQRDRRLSDAGRLRKVAELEGEICGLCQPMWLAGPALEGLADDYRLLVNEVGRLALAEQLLTFVTAQPVTQPNGQCQPVAGTNNEAERTLRHPAEARKTGRTNKTLAQGTQLRERESGFRYTPTSCFETFALPEPTRTLREAIASAARELDQLRNGWLNPPPNGPARKSSNSQAQKMGPGGGTFNTPTRGELAPSDIRGSFRGMPDGSAAGEANSHQSL